jgi:membrane protein CcdC involved in cytochrome C biogenesis
MALAALQTTPGHVQAPISEIVVQLPVSVVQHPITVVLVIAIAVPVTQMRAVSALMGVVGQTLLVTRSVREVRLGHVAATRDFVVIQRIIVVLVTVTVVLVSENISKGTMGAKFFSWSLVSKCLEPGESELSSTSF